jgi:geranylgeranyl diphosphate synthase type I
MPGSAPPPALTAHLPAIEEALRATLPDEGSPLSRAVRYVMGWEDEMGKPSQSGGKRIRPALCLFAAEVFGAGPGEAMPGAVAVELVHNFSLVHDEVQDRDAERHGRPTLWAFLGEAQAINAGDFLYTRAIRALTSAFGPSGRRMAALEVLNAAIERMIAGQWTDISFESRETVTVEEYLAMVEGKTGALLGAPLEIGALLAGVSPAEAAALGVWGRKVGLAFQAHDDYLGIWGDPAQTGKSNKNDLARRKKSLPVVLALGHPEAARAVRDAYVNRLEAQDVAALTRKLERAGVRDATREIAHQLAAEAEAILDGLAVAERRAEFAEIASYLVAREG